MNTVQEQGITHALSRTAIIAGMILGVLAGIWFFLLSAWLQVLPGTLVTQEIDVLFSSDLAARIHTLVGERDHRYEPVRRNISVSHPLLEYTWGKLGRSILSLVDNYLSPNEARILTARLLVATIAGVGVGFFAYLAWLLQLPFGPLCGLFIMYLLFTSNVLVAVPDHMGFSNGLLSVTLVAFAVSAKSPRLWIIGFLLIITLLTGGTTSTNCFLPLAAFVWVSHRYAAQRGYGQTYRWVFLGLSLLVAILGVAAGFSRWEQMQSGDTTAQLFFNGNIIRNPLQAGKQFVLGLIYPAIGPTPEVRVIAKHGMLSYEPLTFCRYDAIKATAALAWTVLFFACCYRAIKDPESRECASLAIGWILFNLFFHNFWGDEFFLYSPHWSCALMILVILGAPHFPSRFVMTTVLIVIIGQAYTLYSVVTVVPILG